MVFCAYSRVMDVALWTGNGSSTRSISGLSFSPEFVWYKSRSNAYAHQLYDVVRGSGVGKNLLSNQTDAEGAGSSTYGYLSSFDSAGFSLAAGDDSTFQWGNQSSATYAAWCWDGGTSTVTNTAGSITSSVRANTSSGFSVVSFTGTGANATIGHGGLVNLANGMIIVKNRSSATNWRVYHSALGNTKAIFLSTTGTPDTSSAYWNNTSPTSTVFSAGSDDGINGNGNAMVAYCFAPVSGYSSFGSYVGTGTGDGPFVFCNFRPRWIMVKSSDWAGGNWTIIDAARDTYNVTTKVLQAENSAAEQNYSQGVFDILSNGFKVKYQFDSTNRSSTTFIYAAFAESPFQYARAR